ncbi:hypothetical protein BDV93DRAFT_505338 [Ceratobasidium sp. AG-I]|nr:hypothetical protein BDV93DRAFT_505338 [Ceratobasidium sp. AG-I]
MLRLPLPPCLPLIAHPHALLSGAPRLILSHNDNHVSRERPMTWTDDLCSDGCHAQLKYQSMNAADQAATKNMYAYTPEVPANAIGVRNRLFVATTSIVHAVHIALSSTQAYRPISWAAMV